LKHSNVVELKCSFYSKGEKVRCLVQASCVSCLLPQLWAHRGWTTA